MGGCDDEYWYNNKNKDNESGEALRYWDLEHTGASRFNSDRVDNGDHNMVDRLLLDVSHGNLANRGSGKSDGSSKLDPFSLYHYSSSNDEYYTHTPSVLGYT